LTESKFDIAIIGSGLGGLICADILGKEGYRVCVLEKNKQIGGCLQTFVRDKTIFDSGVHYIGGLAKGQNLYQVFKYIGILDKLKLQRMDEDCFDKVVISGDPKEYVYAQGYENFIKHLAKDFVGEEQAIRKYCEGIREVCRHFPLYNLQNGGQISDKYSSLETPIKTFIESITNNKTLQSVLVGNSMLYVLKGDQTPLYVHAMILNSYIESSWKCVDGGSRIAKMIGRNIQEQGGEIRRNKKVEKIMIDYGMATGVLLSDGSIVRADQIISNIHPVLTLRLVDSPQIRQSYRHRLESMENGVGGFLVNIVFKKNSFPYQKHNYYYHRHDRTWDLADHTDEDWPLGYCLFLSASSRSDTFAESMTIVSYMRFEEVEKWADTFNTEIQKGKRGADYEAFKIKKAEKLLDAVEELFPGLRNHIYSYYTSTPLTIRDYIGSIGGSMYGVTKDASSPMKTFFSPRTKIPNLYLTGQNLNLHGVLGTVMSGLVTCTSIMGNDDIVTKIRNA